MAFHRIAVAAMFAAVVIAGTPRMSDAHPLHTTITELSVDRSTYAVRAVVRVFASDFTVAVARRTNVETVTTGPRWDAAVASYLGGTFTIDDGGGRRIALNSCGVRKDGDLLWICLEGRTASNEGELRLRNAILCDLFEDQVNIVQIAAPKRSILFTRGDGSKRVF